MLIVLSCLTQNIISFNKLFHFFIWQKKGICKSINCHNMWKQIKALAMDKFAIIIWYCCWYSEAKCNCYTWNSLIFKTKWKGCKLGYIGAILIHKCKFKLPFVKLFSKFGVFINLLILISISNCVVIQVIFSIVFQVL
jgi:hypothetical protein